jgi:DNA-binding response OmpR family regulator
MIVLIVEDEPLLGLDLKAELESAGHEVVGPAECAEDALALADAHHPHAALVDIDLSRPLEGVSVARDLRSRYDVATLFLSGQRDVAHQNSDAAFGYIAKPYRLDDVIRSIEIAALMAEGAPPPTRAAPRSLELFA